MTVLQQCHVNPALVIQIISRIFHLINCWIFNSFIENPSRVTRAWARTILGRVERIRQWSERHDLLLAADCYFQQSLQVSVDIGCDSFYCVMKVCKLLLMEKTDIEILYNEIVDMVDINSIQLRYLLENYVCGSNETRVPQIWIDFVVSGANQVTDAFTSFLGFLKCSGTKCFTLKYQKSLIYHHHLNSYLQFIG